MTTPHARPNHKAIQTYYEELHNYTNRDVTHETAVRSAFQNPGPPIGELGLHPIAMTVDRGQLCCDENRLEGIEPSCGRRPRNEETLA